MVALFVTILLWWNSNSMNNQNCEVVRLRLMMIPRLQAEPVDGSCLGVTELDPVQFSISEDIRHILMHLSHLYWRKKRTRRS